MGKRLPHTPTSKIRSALRKLWLQSRERAAALKRTGYCCERCGVKQSVAKGREVRLEVHHINGIQWFEMIEYVRQQLLVPPEELMPLCQDCHMSITETHDENVSEGV